MLMSEMKLIQDLLLYIPEVLDWLEKLELFIRCLRSSLRNSVTVMLDLTSTNFIRFNIAIPVLEHITSLNHQFSPSAIITTLLLGFARIILRSMYVEL